MTQETYLEMAHRHRDMDNLAKGEFSFKNGKACSVGCFNHDLGNDPSDFAALSKFSTFPEWSHRLQEAVFEIFTDELGRNWHVDHAEASSKVTDWVKCYHLTMVAILEVALPHDTSDGRVVQRVIDLHRGYQDATDDQWAAAWSAAWVAWAAGAAARSAAEAAEATQKARLIQYLTHGEAAKDMPWPSEVTK